jgi:hypothetical protein
MGWPGRAERPKTTVEPAGEASKLKELTMHTRQKSSDPVTTIGLDIGKNTFHLVGLGKRGAVAMRIKVSRSQLVRRLANLAACLVGLEAGSGSHYIARQIQALGHDVRLIPAQYVKPFPKGHKNDYRDAEAIAEAVQRPTMNFVAIKTPEQSDLLSLHRVRSRLIDACRNTLKLTQPGLRAVVQSKGFVPVAQENGMLIAYATAEGELASDVGVGAGPYAKVLAEEIVKPGIEAVIMFRAVQRRVRAATGQEPYLGFNTLGDVYFSGRPSVDLPGP